MGSNAKVFIFDYNTYSKEVVPFFYDILRTGMIPEWLHSVLSNTRRQFDLEKLLKVDLQQHCTWLDKNLAWTGSDEILNIVEADWSERSCKSATCSERKQCPLHQGQLESLAEDLLRLFEMAVSLRCLGESQFVGRSKGTYHYKDMLSEMKASSDLTRLLSFLGERGFVLGYRWGGGEGIHGWLNPVETLELAWHLNHLPLPKYEASFEAIEQFRTWEQYGNLRWGNYECSGFSFEALSLSFVRTVATIASQEGKGILWGNDVRDADFYLNYEK